MIDLAAPAAGGLFEVPMHGGNVVHRLDLAALKRKHEGLLVRTVIGIDRAKMDALAGRAAEFYRDCVVSVDGYSVGGIPLPEARPEDWRLFVPLADAAVAGMAAINAALFGERPLNPPRSGPQPGVTTPEPTTVQAPPSAGLPRQEAATGASTSPATGTGSSG